MTMEAFATFLRPQVAQNGAGAAGPVTDQTELKGAWNFEFTTTLQIRMLNPASSGSDEVTIFNPVESSSA